MRLDQLLVEKGLADSRNQAQSLIRAGLILVDNVVVDKPGTKIKGDPEIRRKGNVSKYVSRGGDKLAAALTAFSIKCESMIFADLGSSTGGFTDCLLQNGAQKVYAIDVGYGQLAWKLRKDERVIVLERTNVRHLESLPDTIDGLVADLSFISLTKILPAMKRIIKSNGEAIVLIKPQFEAGPGKAKGGVVKDPAIRQQAIDKVIDDFKQNDIEVINSIPSPVAGAKKGNIEELVHLLFPVK